MRGFSFMSCGATTRRRMRPSSFGCSPVAVILRIAMSGVEEVLILQGGYRDERGEHRAGDYIINPAGSTHHPLALEGTDDCIMLAIAHGGIERQG